MEVGRLEGRSITLNSFPSQSEYRNSGAAQKTPRGLSRVPFKSADPAATFYGTVRPIINFEATLGRQNCPPALPLENSQNFLIGARKTVNSEPPWFGRIQAFSRPSSIVYHQWAIINGAYHQLASSMPLGLGLGPRTRASRAPTRRDWVN